ncbi:hypothetical protein KIN20_008114 [Parelaphostrongylus tenuis]|uniref:Uncharacterized protein n=1 Tax=Parelaphostrongylus tenuis TaxID=148309 RepID=A0AAD5M6D5_PARTN|nr:hypothetical protein KIN20_008114 [Parelaphostrongylus tenuis]
MVEREHLDIIVNRIHEPSHKKRIVPNKATFVKRFPLSLRNCSHLGARKKTALHRSLDESSDSGHASTGTPVDPFMNLKTDVSEMPLQFPSSSPLIRPPAYGPPPPYPPSHHPVSTMFSAELYQQFH